MGNLEQVLLEKNCLFEVRSKDRNQEIIKVYGVMENGYKYRDALFLVYNRNSGWFWEDSRYFVPLSESHRMDERAQLYQMEAPTTKLMSSKDFEAQHQQLPYFNKGEKNDNRENE